MNVIDFQLRVYCVMHSMSWRCKLLKGAAFTEPHPHPSIVVVEGLNLDKPTTLTFCWFQFAIHKKGQFENPATEDYDALQYLKICWICFESEKTNTFCSLSAAGKWFSMYLRKFKFRKEEEHHYKMYKTIFLFVLRCSKSGCGYWNFQFLFVNLFVCTSRFANFARGKWSNHDSKNCSEIMTVTWTVIWLWKLQFTTSIFFTPL